MDQYEIDLNQFLDKVGIDIEEISDKDLARLKLIYEYTSNKINALHTILNKQIHHRGFTYTEIADYCKFARKTLYNQPFLKDFVDYQTEQYLSIFKGYLLSKNDYVMDLKDENNLLKIRDASYLKLLFDNEELKRKNKELQKQVHETIKNRGLVN